MRQTKMNQQRMMRKRGTGLERRRFLQGLGVCIALPALESIAPPSSAAGRPLARTATGAPLRMAFVYTPNGAYQPNWWPSGGETDFVLNKTMAPLAAMRERLQVFGGLDHINATAGPDGAGDHARANATFLTGVRARKTSGANIHVGTSIDQVAARHVGHLTRFPSLELSCDSVRKSGNCDSGYSCAYQFNLSWRSPTTPMAPEPNPRLVFERLFGNKTGPLGAWAQSSVLDFVMEDAAALNRDLSGNDQRKLDEYLTGVREIERRVELTARFDVPEPDMEAPAGIPQDHAAYLDLTFDMLGLAFQTDATRVATLLLGHDGSNRSFQELGVPEGHHYLTHNQNQGNLGEKLAKIDHYYMRAFARFLERLDAMPDVDGNSVLHNSMIIYGSGIADANRHTHTNLPAILAGAGGGQLQTGRYVRHGGIPMSNLYLSMLDRFGIEGVEEFGDSTGRLDGI